MKKLLLSAAALAFLFTACKKDDDNNGGNNNTWKVGSNTYTATTIVDSSGSLWAVSSSGSSLLIGFDGSALPTTGGSYEIVEFADSAMKLDVSAVVVSGMTGTFYDTKDGSGVNATVTVTGGKVKVVIPEVWGYNVFDANDSMKISGTITQP